MRVDINTTDKYNLSVVIGGVIVGTVSDCDMGRWVLLIDGEVDHDFGEHGPNPTYAAISGCYPAGTYDQAIDVAFGIYECNDDVMSTYADGEEITKSRHSRK